MGANKRDWEERVIVKAEELAQEKYHRDFSDLPPQMEMQVWLEAEGIVNDQIADAMDAARKTVREKGIDHWGELELQRRLGK